MNQSERLVGSDHEDGARARPRQLSWNRVSPGTQKLGNVRGAKAQVTSWCTKMRDPPAIHPVVDSLQIHLTQGGKI